MEVASQRKLSSTLNPNAPSFVPLAYRAVEDFSDEWWTLIHSSPSFRDYWLQERYQEEEHDPNQNLAYGNHDVFLDEPLLPEDDDSLFNDIFVAENYDLIHDSSGNEEGEEYDIMNCIAATEQKTMCVAELSRHAEKSTKSVKAR